MAIPTLQESLSNSTQDVSFSLVTGVGTQVGWLLVAIQGFDYDTGTMPFLTGTSASNWVLVNDSGPIGSLTPRQSIWSRIVTVAGAQTVTFNVDGATDDNHGRVFVFSTGNVGQSVTVIGSGTAVVTTSGSHVAPSLTSPDTESMLMCSWISSQNAGNYTVPADMTAQTETDRSFSTLRTARRNITATGATGTKTATRSPVPTAGYAASSFLVSNYIIPPEVPPTVNFPVGLGRTPPTLTTWSQV